MHFCTVYFVFAQAGHRGTCLRPLHIFALLYELHFVEVRFSVGLGLGIGLRFGLGLG